MNRTKIEWVKNPDGSQGYTWNPITGCLNHENGLCKGGGFPCYAYKLANGRLKRVYLANDSECLNADFKNPFAPRFWFSRLELPKHIKKPSGIFVCDMGELFGSWLEDEQCDFWQKAIFRVINECPQHRFYLLTKHPEYAVKFSPFPENCWVGVTACNGKMAYGAVTYLRQIAIGHGRGGKPQAFRFTERLGNGYDLASGVRIKLKHPRRRGRIIY